MSASVKLEEYKWNIQQRKNKRVIIDDATLQHLEKEYGVVDRKFRNQMKKNLKAQTGDYQGLKKALGRSKTAQGLDENAYLMQKWSDPLKALDKELNEVGASSPQGKKLQQKISSIKAKQKEIKAEHQKKVDAYKKKGGDYKALMERFENGEVIFTKEEGELLPFTQVNIPSYIRDQFREMHKESE